MRKKLTALQKEDLIDMVDALQRALGEASLIWDSIKELGYDDYKINQELNSEYAGNLKDRVDNELPENIDRFLDEIKQGVR